MHSLLDSTAAVRALPGRAEQVRGLLQAGLCSWTGGCSAGAPVFYEFAAHPLQKLQKESKAILLHPQMVGYDAVSGHVLSHAAYRT